MRPSCSRSTLYRNRANLFPPPTDKWISRPYRSPFTNGRENAAWIFFFSCLNSKEEEEKSTLQMVHSTHLSRSLSSVAHMQIRLERERGRIDAHLAQKFSRVMDRKTAAPLSLPSDVRAEGGGGVEIRNVKAKDDVQHD